MQLDDGARVQPGIYRACQPDAAESGRRPQTSHAPQKLRAIGGHAMRSFIGCQKRHTFTELAIEAIGGEQGVFIRIELRHDMRLMRIPRCTEHPFGVIGDGHTAWTVP